MDRAYRWSVDCGAETILLPPLVLLKGLLLLRLPRRGIFQLDGEGEGKISLSEIECRDLGSESG